MNALGYSAAHLEEMAETPWERIIAGHEKLIAEMAGAIHDLTEVVETLAQQVLDLREQA